MLSGEDFVTNPGDQLKCAVVEPLAGVVCGGGSFFQSRIGRNELSWNEIMADAEVFERALSLGAPQLVRGDLDHTEAVSLFSRGGHWTSPSARCRGFSFECAKPPCGELATVRIPCIPHMVSRRLGGGFHGQLLV